MIITPDMIKTIDPFFKNMHVMENFHIYKSSQKLRLLKIIKKLLEFKNSLPHSYLSYIPEVIIISGDIITLSANITIRLNSYRIEVELARLDEDLTCFYNELVAYTDYGTCLDYQRLIKHLYLHPVCYVPTADFKLLKKEVPTQCLPRCYIPRGLDLGY